MKKKTIGVAWKRMAGVVLGAVLLFTAVGRMAPMQVQAGVSISITLGSQANGTSSNSSAVNVTEGSSYSFLIQFTDNLENGARSLVMERNMATGNVSVESEPGTIASGSSGEYVYKMNTAGSGSIRLVLKTTGGSNAYTHTVEYNFNIQAPSPGTGTSTGSGTGSSSGTGASTGTGTGGATGAGTGASTGSATGEDAPAHSHNFVWETRREATEDVDGEMVYVCTVCGEVEQRVPFTGYYLFQKEAADMIRAAAPDATVDMKTSKWISFHKSVIHALAERPDVTLNVSFLEEEYKGERRSFTIPAGSEVLTLLDENGYAGFKYLGGVFGME